MIKQQPGWVLPDLRAASRRTHTASVIEKSLFSIPDECRNMGKGRRYYVRTYGCQANERDSETLAGILEALGYAPAKGEEDADVILTSGAIAETLGDLGVPVVVIEDFTSQTEIDGALRRVYAV